MDTRPGPTSVASNDSPSPSTSEQTPIINVALFVVAVIIALGIIIISTSFFYQCLRTRRERKTARKAAKYLPRTFSLRAATQRFSAQRNHDRNMRMVTPNHGQPPLKSILESSKWSISSQPEDENVAPASSQAHIALPAPPTLVYDSRKSVFKSSVRDRESVWFDHINTDTSLVSGADSSLLSGSFDASVPAPVHVAHRVPAQALYDMNSKQIPRSALRSTTSTNFGAGTPQRMTRAYHFSVQADGGSVAQPYHRPESPPTPTPRRTGTHATQLSLKESARTFASTQPPSPSDSIPSSLTPGGGRAEWTRSLHQGMQRINLLSFTPPPIPASEPPAISVARFPSAVSSPTISTLPADSSSRAVLKPTTMLPSSRSHVTVARLQVTGTDFSQAKHRPRSYWLQSEDWLASYPSIHEMPVRGISDAADTAVDYDVGDITFGVHSGTGSPVLDLAASTDVSQRHWI